MIQNLQNERYPEITISERFLGRNHRGMNSKMSEKTNVYSIDGLPFCTKGTQNPLVENQHFADFEMQSEHRSYCDLLYNQLTCGEYEGNIFQVGKGRPLCFVVEESSQKLQQHVGMKDKDLVIAIPMRPGNQFVVNDQRGFADDIMIARPGGDINMISPVNGALLTIGIKVTNLELLAAFEGVECLLSKNLGDVSVYRAASMAKRIKEDALSAMNMLSSTHVYRDQNAIERIETAALNSILGQLQLYMPVLIGNSAKRMQPFYDIFSQVQKAVEASGQSPVDYKFLTEVTGYSKRTLQHAFNNYVEMTPIQYSRAVRLNIARRRLLHDLKMAETIGDVADASGFCGWSKFTQRYAELFGERPSETRKSLQCNVG